MDRFEKGFAKFAALIPIILTIIPSYRVLFPLTITYLLYSLGFVWAQDFVYFWDNILQTSIEAHKFYGYGFNPFMLNPNSLPETIHSTGYHPPLLAYITAVLWETVTYKLWVSHALALLAALLLIYNTAKLVQPFVSEQFRGWVVLLVLLEPTVLTQYVIASPDFFLLAAFITALRLIIQNKLRFLPLVLVFVFGMSMRGTFLGFILLGAHLLYTNHFQMMKKWTWKNLSIIQYYIPALVLLGLYYTLYLYQFGWFFKNQQADGHYAIPQNISVLVKHFLDFGVRSVENGRILIWILSVGLCMKIVYKKVVLNDEQKLLFTLVILHFALYFVFIFLTQVPFSGRYFMAHYFLMSLMVFSYFFNRQEVKQKTIIVLSVLILEISGHCWIYPEPIAKAWDTTLAHVPYYDLRKVAFSYLDKENIGYSSVGAGFCLTTDQQFVDLNSQSRIIHSDLSLSYFLYSNISNVTDDVLIQIQNPQLWQIEKKWNKGAVEFILYRKK